MRAWLSRILHNVRPCRIRPVPVGLYSVGTFFFLSGGSLILNKNRKFATVILSVATILFTAVDTFGWVTLTFLFRSVRVVLVAAQIVMQASLIRVTVTELESPDARFAGFSFPTRFCFTKHSTAMYSTKSHSSFVAGVVIK